MVHKATELSGQDATAHQILGSVFYLRRQYDKAIVECKKAIDLRPISAEANFYYGHALRWTGRFEEAILAFKKAIRLNPIKPLRYMNNLAWAYALSGQYEKAIALWTEAINRNADYFFAHLGLDLTYQLSGKEHKARNAASEVLRLKPNLTISKLKKGPATKNIDRDRLHDALRKAGIPDSLPKKEPENPSIAVLPFDNMSNDPEQVYFADGISEDLKTDLSKISNLLVISRMSSFTYKGKNIKVQQIAKELRVRYVLEGSVRKVENRVRINAQLIDATTGHHLWAERYDGDASDIFTLQDTITRKIISALALKLTTSEQKAITDKGTDNRKHTMRF